MKAFDGGTSNIHILHKANGFAISIIDTMKVNPGHKQPWRPLDWQYKVFEKKIPASMSKLTIIQLLFKGIMLWTIWLEINDFTLNNNRWDIVKTHQMIWQGLLEYAIAWEIVCKEADKAINYKDVVGDYDEIQGGTELLYHRDNMKTMHSKIKAPNVGLIDHP